MPKGRGFTPRFDKLIESIQSGKELSTELEGDMIELLKALKAERNDAGSKKNLYN